MADFPKGAPDDFPKGAPRRPQRLSACLLLALATLLLAGCSSPFPLFAHRGAPSPTPSVPVSPAPGSSSTASIDAERIAARAMPSIATVVANLGGGSYDQGSAFAIQSEGGATWLLTNNHVVRGAGQISVIFENGAHYVAQLRGTDADEDVAVLGVPTQVPMLTLGDSSRVVVGQPVVAIGSPEGLQGTVTTGIISAPHRTLTVTDENGKNPETLADAMQTDAAINPGNSGGPLFDARGDVIGMNTAGATGANDLSFAIPSLVARRIAMNLIAGKAPGNTYAGLCYLSSEDAVAAGKSFSGYGALVTGTVAAGPAANAGIQTGDVIEKLAGTPLNDGETVGGVLQLHNPGDTISVALTRNGESRTVNLTLGDQPASHVSC